ncbi:hypothetical protein [Aquabacter spiritensis]|uniref:Uncharacterized protein n=1 Tax=Aquabacter spiritensis TaxID=933073 RepID=A0A4R3LN41_9HYPH|nr:hypothetical protein [Aquabacter spiritensis]TCT01521.1 hypothetical protein EDC64_11819 [Aquabacter spiritensis]
MKTLICAGAALVCATAAFAADPLTITPGFVVKTPVDVVVPVIMPAPPPTAMVVERITMYSLLETGWTPVSAAIIPESGVPGTHGAFAHVNGKVVRLYKGGVYADCGIAQVGGAYNDCRILTPGTR